MKLDLATEKLYIDGAEFPWYISEEGPSFGPMTDQRDLRRMTITILAEDVETVPANAQDNAAS